MIKKYQIFRTLSARVLCCVLIGSAVAAGAWLFPGARNSGLSDVRQRRGAAAQAVKPHDFSPRRGTCRRWTRRVLPLWAAVFPGCGISGARADCLPARTPKPRRVTTILSAPSFLQGGTCAFRTIPKPCRGRRIPRYMVEDSGCGTQMFRSAVRSGDNAGSLFLRWLDNNETDQAVKAASSVYSLTKIMPGHLFSVERDKESGQVSRFFYDIDEESRLVIERAENGFSPAWTCLNSTRSSSR